MRGKRGIGALVLLLCFIPAVSWAVAGAAAIEERSGSCMTVSCEELMARIQSGRQVIIVDCRPAEEYEAGHVPGAVNVSMDSYGFERETVLKRAIEDVYEQAGRRMALVLIDAESKEEYMPISKMEELSRCLPENRSTEIVFYCRRPACTRSPMAAGWAEALGYRNVLRYEGGWEEWSEKGRPVETGSPEHKGGRERDTSDSIPLEDLIDVAGLDRSGHQWRTVYQQIGRDAGHARLGQSKWLMYFLHWRPLTDAGRTLTVDYIRNHMLNFWGQAMNFELSDTDGEMEVCGHRAVFTEGTVMGGAVRTRFIVWNCLETNRQFTADCNINIKRKTPAELLELQRTITGTVRCHEGVPHGDEPACLPQVYASEEWNVSFHIPSTWRTADYESEEWFPQGMSAQNGSLWTLVTDSVKRVELVWERSAEPLSAGTFERFMDACAAPYSRENVTSRITSRDIGGIEEREGMWRGEGTYELRLTVEGTGRTAVYPFRFEGLLWKDGPETYFLLISLVQIGEFWNIPVDLSPYDETFERYVREEVFPNISCLPTAARTMAK
jgi:rhodanese-related sulfurtransferase